MAHKQKSTTTEWRKSNQRRRFLPYSVQDDGRNRTNWLARCEHNSDEADHNGLKLRRLVQPMIIECRRQHSAIRWISADPSSRVRFGKHDIRPGIGRTSLIRRKKSLEQQSSSSSGGGSSSNSNSNSNSNSSSSSSNNNGNGQEPRTQ